MPSMGCHSTTATRLSAEALRRVIMELARALVMGVCIAALAPVGDLFESLVKRDLKIKDSGRVFGPHGGLLDRLDALLFTIVVGYYLAVAFVY